MFSPFLTFFMFALFPLSCTALLSHCKGRLTSSDGDDDDYNYLASPSQTNDDR